MVPPVPPDDAALSDTGTKVLRGGDWYVVDRGARCANRWGSRAINRGLYFGFRLAR